MNRFREFVYKVSENHTRTCWVLKCDIRKFFASIDQEILLHIVGKQVSDAATVQLISEIIHSFYSSMPGKGLPLGNLTSQLLVNIYMNEFDKFVKHKLKVKQYIRYADDFVVLSPDRTWLVEVLPHMEVFLRDRLQLQMHPDKVSISTIASGIDFLGWVHFPDHRVLRTATKRRMLNRVATNPDRLEVIDSYRGLLSHGNARQLQKLLPHTKVV